MSDDFENPSWDTDDTDIGGDDGFNDEAASSAQTTDVVAKLISGDLTPDEVEVPEKVEGRQWKALGQSRFIDGSGKTDWTAGGQLEESEPAKEPVLPEDYEKIYQDQINDLKENAEKTYDEAHKNNQQLTQMFEEGLIDEVKYQELAHAEGVKAGRAMFEMQQAELMSYKMKEQHQEAHKQMTELLGDDVWGSPEARAETIKKVQDFTKEMGIDPEILAEVEDAPIARAFVEAAQNHVLVAEQKDEIARLKGQVRRLSKVVKTRKEKQRKDASRGVRNEDALDEVARLLEGKI